MTPSKMTPSKEVKHYCRLFGIKISPVGKDKVICLSKGNWVDCFDNWVIAHMFLISSKNKLSNSGIVPAWIK